MELRQASPPLAASAHESAVPTIALLIPRLYLGVVFGVAVLAKLQAPAGFAKSLAGFLNGVALTQGFGWYQDLVRGFILPHVGLFATLVVLGEACVAVTMLLGLFTRAGAALAIFLLLNYLSAKGMAPWSPASNDAADIVLALTVAWTNAGRSFGIDGVWNRYARKSRGSRLTA
ncbi:MAG TPA: DoxX family protein [Candidatus Baltobacteraceae bacterium]|jgi:uncharacterized membrane protein YphA (DoxX/SURF4 family)|nr:DoxX family protein [Candidatus Baltobacteraceae bacterium]